MVLAKADRNGGNPGWVAREFAKSVIDSASAAFKSTCCEDAGNFADGGTAALSERCDDHSAEKPTGIGLSPGNPRDNDSALCSATGALKNNCESSPPRINASRNSDR